MNDLIEYQKQRNKKRRRIMREMRLDEISGVDHPAQEGAEVVIFKSGAANMEPQTFEQAVEIVKRQAPALTRTGAMKEARRRWPDLLDKFHLETVSIQARDEVVAKQAEEDRQPAPVVRAFAKRVDDAQKSAAATGRPISRTEALRRAAREMPAAEFEDYRRVAFE